jgi:predicted outer membrane repeat protein
MSCAIALQYMLLRVAQADCSFKLASICVSMLCSGGALLMRGASCPEAITWQQAVFINNSAGADGGAMYLTEMAKRKLVGQARFEGNMVSCCKDRCGACRKACLDVFSSTW